LGQFPATMLGTFGRALTAYGRPEEGLATLDEALALLDRRALIDEEPAPEHEGPLLSWRVDALVELGRFEEAELALAKSLKLIGDRPGQAGFAFGARRRLWLVTGRAETALSDFDGRPTPPGLDPTGPMGRHAERAWIAVSAGQDDLARTEAQAALTAIEASPAREYLRDAEAKPAFTLGLALLHRGDAGAALAPLQRAEELRRSMFDAKRSLALADVLLAQVSARGARHDNAGAKRALQEARAIFPKHSSVGAQRLRALRNAGAEVW
jgi:tetratricopeptide (TPR) repeat protein